MIIVVAGTDVLRQGFALSSQAKSPLPPFLFEIRFRLWVEEIRSRRLIEYR